MEEFEIRKGDTSVFDKRTEQFSTVKVKGFESERLLSGVPFVTKIVKDDNTVGDRRSA